MRPVLFAPPGSAAARWAEGLAWLWRLGELSDVAMPSLIGVGTEADAASLGALVDAGGLAGAIVLVGEHGDRRGRVPASRRTAGVAEFDRGTRVEGELIAFTEGEPAVASTLGAHAVIEDGVAFIGHQPERDAGRLDHFWVYELAQRFISERADAELTRLPPIGALRLDDVPGIALHQLQGRARGDRSQASRIARTARRLRSAGAVLNVAVAAEALDGDERVPLERIWPRAVQALRAGIELGAYETVCHGLLHLDTDALAAGEIEFREFARLDAAEAGERLDRALEWQSRHLSRPTTFVAPAWSYGAAGDEEAAKRGLVRWHRAAAGPVLDDGRLHETLIGELLGLHRLDYSPLERLAAAGVPPMIAMHGALLDGRLARIRSARDPLLLARLAVRRDVTRIMRLAGIRWLGAAEFVAALRAHEA